MAKKTKTESAACEALGKMILRNPDLTREQVQEKAKAAGHAVSDSTAKTVHSPVHSTLRSLERLGLYAPAGIAKASPTKPPKKAAKSSE